MTDSSSQNQCDRILWILSEHGGKMDRSGLREATGLKLAALNQLLDGLARDSKINIAPGKHGDIISLKT
jgi:hypothetical protein